MATHSGTCLGLLLDPGSLRYPDVLPELVGELLAHHRPGVRVYRTYSFEYQTTTEVMGEAWHRW